MATSNMYWDGDEDVIRDLNTISGIQSPSRRTTRGRARNTQTRYVYEPSLTGGEYHRLTHETSSRQETDERVGIDDDKKKWVWTEEKTAEVQSQIRSVQPIRSSNEVLEHSFGMPTAQSCFYKDKKDRQFSDGRIKELSANTPFSEHPKPALEDGNNKEELTEPEISENISDSHKVGVSDNCILTKTETCTESRPGTVIQKKKTRRRVYNNAIMDKLIENNKLSSSKPYIEEPRLQNSWVGGNPSNVNWHTWPTQQFTYTEDEFPPLS